MRSWASASVKGSRFFGGRADQGAQDALPAVQEGDDGSFDGDREGGGDVAGRPRRDIVVDDRLPVGQGPRAEALLGGEGVVEGREEVPGAGMEEELPALLSSRYSVIMAPSAFSSRWA